MGDALADLLTKQAITEKPHSYCHGLDKFDRGLADGVPRRPPIIPPSGDLRGQVRRGTPETVGYQSVATYWVSR
jgi:hypothetical protein